MARPIFLVAAVLAAGAGLAAALTLSRDAGTDCFDSAVAGASIGGPFTLVDQTGQTVTDAQVIDRPTLVYFGYTFCPDICPVDVSRNLAALDLAAQSGVDAQAVMVTVDTARDTPQVLADYAANLGGGLIGLTGSDAQIRAAADAYRVVYSRSGEDPDYYLMNHSAFTYLMLPETGFATFFRRETTPQEIADQLVCAAGGD